jgi:divalent metal cation (Fe/Co/Zn/Cd) transporter
VVGVVISLVLVYFLQYMWIDSVVAILMACFIIYTGYKIIRTSIAGIMDEADEALLQQMVNKLNANRKENWIDLHNLRIIKYGSTLHIDCHLTVPWYLNVHEDHNEIDGLSTLVKNEFGESMELFVHSDGCLDFSCKICSKQQCDVRKHAFEKNIVWTMQNISSNNKHRI